MPAYYNPNAPKKSANLSINSDLNSIGEITKN